MTTMQIGDQAFDLRDPFVHDFSLADAVKALSNLCRFQGRTHKFYSVAQHSVLVSALCDATCPWDGLAHDLAEAYTGDVITPWKQLLREEGPLAYARLKTIEQAVENAFLFNGTRPEVKAADLVALVTERRDLLPRAPHLNAMWPAIEPLPYSVAICLSPEEAEAAWWKRYQQLLARRQAPWLLTP